MFTLRFDMRAPSAGAPSAELYAAALEMTSWAEERGAVAAIVCEHHGQADGYLPSPMILASALAARTTTIRIVLAVVVLPLYDPIRLAEEMVVLDIISSGRVSYVCGVGYREEEYNMFGVDFRRRGRIADEWLSILLRAKTGEPFDHSSRTIQVTPAPLTAGGPSVSWGGGSEAAARRAGRNGLGFFAQTEDEGLRRAFEDAARGAGHEPGWCFLPPNDLPTSLFVADDVDGAWDELGPYLMHDARSYAALNVGGSATASVSFAGSIEELRAEGRSHRIVCVDEAISMARSGLALPLHPLVGGLPPEIAWPYLRTVTDHVIPAL
ncbi:MAG: LLM class flavin-dependent oxidoreductase [Acidimicrobiales bacterium]|jgi:alkanesulfonate monooxygenase SsuD/methylene tetrahydromethanopterin reductase-like flavin-dependent oxidoreductase (luciferase family)